MPPPCSQSSRATTVAGTPNSRDLTGARAPLLSHTTARSRHAGTSFESQATRAGRRLESQPTGTPQRYEPGSLPSRPGSQRLPTIGRLLAHRPVLPVVTNRDRAACPDAGWVTGSVLLPSGDRMAIGVGNGWFGRGWLAVWRAGARYACLHSRVSLPRRRRR